MIQSNLEKIPFWKPVSLTFDNQTEKTCFSKGLWMIASYADQLVSFKRKTLQGRIEWIDEEPLKFKIKNERKNHLILIALKATSYALALIILPIPALALLTVALTVKAIYKKQLNKYHYLSIEENKEPDLIQKELLGLEGTKTAMKEDKPNQIIAEKKIGDSSIILLTGSILAENTDAIVNAANDELLPGTGVCGAIRKGAGFGPFKECKEILENQHRESLDIGEAVMTTSGTMVPRVKYVVHAVGPDFRVKSQRKKGFALLANAYRNALNLAFFPQENLDYLSRFVKDPSLKTHSSESPPNTPESSESDEEDLKDLSGPDSISDIEETAEETDNNQKIPKDSQAVTGALNPTLVPLNSITFPSISTGVFEAPLEESATTALQTIKEVLEQSRGGPKVVKFVFLPLEEDAQKTASAYLAAINKL